MNVRLLVDGLVRQTTILIAQLSTTASVRAPLAHVADQVFLDLAREIEGQGVGRKVVADMFGLALRSYQKKIQRLTASATDGNRTLWQAVLEFLRDGSKSRARIDERFAYDGAREVGAVLSDLVASGPECELRLDLYRGVGDAFPVSHAIALTTWSSTGCGELLTTGPRKNR